MLIAVHLLLVGMWFGCVAVELLLENAPGKIPALRAWVPLLHFKIDKFVEIPIVVSVLITGFLLVDPRRLSGIYLVKVTCGLGAALANLICFLPITKRMIAAEKSDSAGIKRHSIFI